MQLPFEWRIGLRYLRASKRARRNSFISFISLVSVLGIALGVAALIIILSVMNGFQKDVRDRMLAVVAHIEVAGKELTPVEWQEVKKEVSNHPQVVASAPFVSSETVLLYRGEMKGALLRGVAPAAEKGINPLPLSFRNKGLESLSPGEFGAIIGVDMARHLKLQVGDRVSVMVPQASFSPAGLIPRFKVFTVIDIFESGHYDYDANLVYIHIEDAQTLLRLEQAQGLRLRVDDVIQAPLVAFDMQIALWHKPYASRLWVTDWSQQNRNWFAAVQTEKRLMAIILTLIIAVAAFNLVSSLVMTVTEKYGDIAILRTLGASRRSIMKIFMIQGALSGCLGTFSGVAGGILVALNVDVIVPAIESLLGVQFLPKSIYLIDTLPSDLHASDVIVIGSISLLLSLLATLYPSYRAARVQPAEALRAE